MGTSSREAGVANGPAGPAVPDPADGPVGGRGSLRDGLARWAARGIDLVFPPRCPICLREPEDASVSARGGGGPRIAPLRRPIGRSPCGQVCGDCHATLRDTVVRCRRCGSPAMPAGGCRECRLRPCVWRNIAVLAGYTDELRQAVLRAKRPAGEDVVGALAAVFLASHREAIASWGIDRVVPVPMHWLRRMMRGTSAAEGLARSLAAGMRLPWSREIRRWRATPMQNELPPGLRPGNVRDAFRVRRRLPGARILLVDDVVTTGATLAACTRVLLDAGAASVDVAVMARADRGAGDADSGLHAP